MVKEKERRKGVGSLKGVVREEREEEEKAVR